MTYIEMCMKKEAEPKDWKAWLEQNKKEEDKDNELLGLLPEEYEDLSKEVRSFQFYVFKRSFTRSIFNLWGGCYVKYLFEYNGCEPHVECGWVDAVSNTQGFCKIQCDDDFQGGRAVTVRIIDVMEVLPHKERPLIYYKTMLCGQCNKCDHSSNEEPKIDCPHYEFMNAILNKQKGDDKFIELYKNVSGKFNDACQCDKHDCQNCGKHI